MQLITITLHKMTIWHHFMCSRLKHNPHIMKSQSAENGWPRPFVNFTTKLQFVFSYSAFLVSALLSIHSSLCYLVSPPIFSLLLPLSYLVSSLLFVPLSFLCSSSPFSFSFLFWDSFTIIKIYLTKFQVT